MNTSRTAMILLAAAAALFAAAWLTSAGPLSPPAGPVSSTGVTTQELADLIAGGDPCQCLGLRQAAFETPTNITLLGSTQDWYVKRVSITKTAATADVYLQLREPDSGVIGVYRLRPDEGSLVADIDMVLTGLVIQSLSVSTGSIQIAVTFKEAS